MPAIAETSTYVLSYPPSVNNYWKRNRNGGVRISAKGVEFRKDVARRIGQVPTLYGRLAVVISTHAPDKRKRDLDNVLKALLDAMEHAGVFADDGQIDHLSVTRGDIRKNYSCVIVAVGEIK